MYDMDIRFVLRTVDDHRDSPPGIERYRLFASESYAGCAKIPHASSHSLLLVSGRTVEQGRRKPQGPSRPPTVQEQRIGIICEL
jgi:hypothetical protein